MPRGRRKAPARKAATPQDTPAAPRLWSFRLCGLYSMPWPCGALEPGLWSLVCLHGGHQTRSCLLARGYTSRHTRMHIYIRARDSMAKTCRPTTTNMVPFCFYSLVYSQLSRCRQRMSLNVEQSSEQSSGSDTSTSLRVIFPTCFQLHKKKHARKHVHAEVF